MNNSKLILKKALLIVSMFTITSYCATDVPPPFFPESFIGSLRKIAQNQPLTTQEYLGVQNIIFQPQYAQTLANLLSCSTTPAASSLSAQSCAARALIGTLAGHQMPVENRDNSFDNFLADSPDSSHILNQARGFAQQPLTSHQSQFMYWTGLAGQGKTHLATAVVNELLSQGQRVLFLQADKMSDYFCETVGIAGYKAEKCLAPYDAVIIDDLNTIDRLHVLYLRDLILLAFNQGDRKIIVTSNKPYELFIRKICSEYGGALSEEQQRLISRTEAMLKRSPGEGIIDFSVLPSKRR